MPRLQLPVHTSCLNPRTTRSSSSWRPSCSRKETVFLYVLSVKLICVLFCLLWFCSLLPYVLLCCWGVVPVLHTVLPKEHSLGVIFFSSLSSCKCCIQFYLHFTTDYTCMIVYVTNNKEPEPVVSLADLLDVYSEGYSCFCTKWCSPQSCSFANGYVHAV